MAGFPLVVSNDLVRVSCLRNDSVFLCFVGHQAVVPVGLEVPLPSVKVVSELKAVLRSVGNIEILLNFIVVYPKLHFGETASREGSVCA